MVNLFEHINRMAHETSPERAKLERAVELLLDNTNGFTVDILTGERWERPGAFWMIATRKNPIVAFDQWKADGPYLREYVADRIDEYMLTERGNFDALGVYLCADGFTVHIDAVEAFNHQATLGQALKCARDNGQEGVGVMEGSSYLGTILI